MSTARPDTGASGGPNAPGGPATPGSVEASETPGSVEASERSGSMEVSETPSDLAAAAHARLAGLLADATGTVLLDVPSHPNVGDSAIWLGERALLGGLDRTPALECDIDTFYPDALRRAAAGRTVLIHGGGNLGDLWPAHQALRERGVSVIRERPVIQLPQSIHFRSEEALARARRVLGAHPDLTLLCRDDRSAERARRYFDGARVERCPDLALCLPARVLEAYRARRPSTDILWLVRSDHESAWPDRRFPAGARDWLDEPRSAAGIAVARLAPRVRRRAGSGIARTLYTRALAAAAAARVARGIRLLSSARVVVTDRLHAHILCALLGVPHVVLPDGFGKIEAHLATWPALARVARRAADPDRAAELARALLAEAT